jgi:hypothetical protein
MSCVQAAIDHLLKVFPFGVNSNHREIRDAFKALDKALALEQQQRMRIGVDQAVGDDRSVKVSIDPHTGIRTQMI